MTMTAISKTTMINTDVQFTRNFFRRNWLILGMALVGASLSGSLPMFNGVLAGGLISIASFYWLNRSLKSLFGEGSGASKFMVQLLSMLKLVIIALVLLLLFLHVDLNPFGLLFGLSTIVLNVFYVAIKSIFTGDLK